MCVCAKGSQRRKDTPCRRIDNNDNDDEVFQGSVLLRVFVAVVIGCSLFMLSCIYMTIYLFVCFAIYWSALVALSISRLRHYHVA